MAIAGAAETTGQTVPPPAGLDPALRDAERAATNLRLLHGVTAALAATLEEATVAHLVVSMAREALGACGGLLVLVRDDGRLEVAGHEGYDDDLIRQFGDLPVDAPLPVAEAVRTGELVVVESAPEPEHRDPDPAAPTATQAAVPILVDGRALGALGFSFHAARGFDSADRDLLVSLAHQCGQALLRARLLDAERQARERAEVNANRLERLQRLTAALSSARTVSDVADAVVRHGLDSPGATSGGLWVPTDDGTALRLAGAAGMRPGVPERFATIPLDLDLPGADVFRTRCAAYVSSRAERDARWPALAGTPTDVEAIAIVPLVVDDRAVGCLALGFREQRGFDESKRRFLETVAQQCAQALERARLYDAERLAARRFRFLAQASEALASTLDYERTLTQVAELGLGVLGELCVLDIVEHGELRRVAIAHSDPAKRALLEGLRDNRMQSDSRAAEALRTGRPVRVAEVTDDDLRVATDSEEHFRLALQLAPGPAVVVPLVIGGRSIGLLYFSAPRGSRPYSDDDMALAEELAGRAAVAVENARLFAQRSDVAQVLQRSLLPPRLPDVPGVELAARFRPFAQGLDVGGDFYDVFPVDGRWAVAIGDVVGTGPAAAATTALVRHTARAVARHVLDPVSVAVAVNEALGAAGDDSFCTLVFALLERHPDAVRLRLVCAGHPVPYVVRADGTVEELRASGSLLGPFPRPELAELPVTLRPGDALVTYTDGVVEARRAGAAGALGPDDFFGDARLRAVLAGPAAHAAELAGRVEAAVLDFAGGQAGDDVAILVVRAR